MTTIENWEDETTTITRVPMPNTRRLTISTQRINKRRK